jgi:DNA-binding HxlR family transcriptional regulator
MEVSKRIEGLGKMEEILKLLGALATLDILNFLNEHGRGQYADFKNFASVSTLNDRLQRLEESGLINHHVEKKNKKEEWYELTITGKNVFQHVEGVYEILIEEKRD